MCKFCAHPDLRAVSDRLRTEYGPTPTKRTERKALLKRIEPRLRWAKQKAKVLRRLNSPFVYKIDYIKDALSFAAMVLNTPDWTNGGNLIL